MDEFFYHLGHLRRRHPAPAHVLAAGYYRAKNHRVTRTYGTFNISLILSGSGSCRSRGVMLPVAAPCVLVQWPGGANDYGPHATWRELYLIYPPEAEEHFRRLAVFDRSCPLWPARTSAFMPRAEELIQMLVRSGGAAEADSLDRLAELAAVESVSAGQAPAGRGERIILSIRSQVETGTLANAEAEALRRGLSQSTFRRLWRRLVGPPPGRYAVECRLRLAAQRLADGCEPIQAIARASGFGDPLHFSRRFRAFAGISPRAYRERAVETRSLDIAGADA